MGWCPGVRSVAMWIPDKEYSDRRVFASSMTVFMVILGISLLYSSSLKPSSYSWDIEFTEAAYDDVLSMYMIEKHADMNGIYNTSIWADSTEGENILIRCLYRGPTYRGTTETLLREWRIFNGVIQSAQDEYRLPYNTYQSARVPTVWKIYSSSRDQKVHIRIQYLEEYPVFQPP
jgi:hypothetical protein